MRHYATLCSNGCRLLNQHLVLSEVPVVIVVAFLACVLASDVSNSQLHTGSLQEVINI